MTRETSRTRHSSRRLRLAALTAVVVAALVALPANAVSGKPADPGLREYIGFLAAPSAGAVQTTPGCRALMATARRATGLS